MRKIFIASLLFVTFFFQSCNKDKAEPKPAIAAIPLYADIMQASTDTASTDIPYPCIITLNADKTFTLDLQGAQSYGTYTWTPTVEYTAAVKFTIKHWEIPATDTAKASKLKIILETVNKCEFPGDPFFGAVFTGTDYTTFFRANKQ